MTDSFADQRVQFFLRNREDIKRWAALEAEVTTATRELLAGSQQIIEERIAAIDPQATVGRHDSGPWERIMTRRVSWPPAVGLALEWHNRGLDPLGAYPPKIGVFWWAEPSSLIAPRARLPEIVDRLALQQLGFRVPLEGVWPVGARVASAPDWWRNPDAWLAGMIETLAAAWPLVAPGIDQALVGVEWAVSGA